MGIGGGGMNSAAGFDDEDNDVRLEVGEDINEDMPPEALWAEFKDGNEGT